MAKLLELGRKGEDLASNYMKESGFQVLERNWRHRPAEIDIICQRAELLVFVEVKSRTDKGYTVEEWGINDKKMRILTDGAYSYMNEHKWTGEFRFDIIIVRFDVSGASDLHHFPDAFFPGIEGF